MAKQKADKPRLSEAQIRAMVADGKTFPQIAAETGVPVGNLRAACSILGIASPYKGGGRIATVNTIEALDHLRRGDSIDDYASSIGVSRHAVYQALKRAGLPASARAVLKHLAQGEK